MTNNEDSKPSQRIGGGNQQLVIITQLLQMSVNMRHIDEMFLWLSHTIAQRLNVDVIQFWSYQADVTGQYSAELRATASQNTLFPLHVVNNTQVAEIARDMLVERMGANSQPVASVFSSHQADLLTRYNLHYWSCFFLSSGELLPPLMSGNHTHESIPTPLTMVISLFTQQVPHPNLLSTISRILEHALSIAKNRGLVFSAAYPASSDNPGNMGNFVNDRVQPRQLMLSELVAHPTQDTEAMQADNPFAYGAVIADKQARRLYFFIDGKKSIAEIANSAHMDQQEVSSALRFLVKQKHIRLHEPDGKAVDSSQFFELI